MRLRLSQRQGDGSDGKLWEIWERMGNSGGTPYVAKRNGGNKTGRHQKPERQ
jgi:hypothetical protein